MEAEILDTMKTLRGVTPEEIAHYREHGRVKLAKFIPSGVTDALLAMAKKNGRAWRYRFSTLSV